MADAELTWLLAERDVTVMVEAATVLFCHKEVFWAVAVLAAVTRGSRCCQVLLFLLFYCRPIRRGVY